MEFVPLLSELILSSRTGGANPQSSYMPGDRLVWRAETAAETAGLKLLGPDGRERPVAPARSGRGGLASEAVGEPGLYRWESDGPACRLCGGEFFQGVESDLRALSSSRSGLPRSFQLSSGAVVAHLREGVPLWPWLLAAGVLLVVLEGLCVVMGGAHINPFVSGRVRDPRGARAGRCFQPALLAHGGAVPAPVAPHADGPCA